MPEPQGAGSWLREWWANPWSRGLLIAAAVATGAWAVRETAVITTPVLLALQTALVPLAIGFTIAYVLTPAVDGLCRLGLRRSVAASVLFVTLGVTGAAVAALSIPALIRQGGELTTRIFSDRWYLDRDGNMRRDRGEPMLLRVQDGERVYFVQDRDGDGRPGEADLQLGATPIAEHSQGGPGIRREVALLSQFTDWVDRSQSRLEILLAARPEPRAMAFLAWYAQRMQPLRTQLRNLLEQPEQAAGEASETLQWDASWPWAQRSELERLAQRLTPQERARWYTALTALGGRLWAERSALLSAWRTLLDNPEAAPETLRAVVSQALPEESRALAEAELARLRGSDRPADRELLRVLYAGSENHDADVGQRAFEQLRQVFTSRTAALGELAGSGADAALRNIGGLLQLSLDVLLVPIYAFFLTLGMPQLRALLRRYLPIKNEERTLRIVHDIERVVAAFFRGRLIVCVICALLCCLGFLIIGVPYAILFGVLIGLATAIPLAGLVILAPAVALVLGEGGDHLLWTLGFTVAVYAVVQALEATVLTPLIMGREVQLNPVVLLVALVFLGNLLGVLGLLLAVPIAATGRILMREFLLPRLREAAGVMATKRLARLENDRG